MKVLDMVRTEFNVDERRIYLMGHSMDSIYAFFAKHSKPASR